MAEYADFEKLKGEVHNGRYLRTEFGAANASTNGHPSASGALDQKVLCSFRKDGICAKQPNNTRTNTNVATQAVRTQMMHGQLDGSFRSYERVAQNHVERSRKTQAARCVRLLETTN